MQNSPEEQMLTIAGHSLHLMTAGTASPVLYLHGSGGGGRFSPFLAQLAQSHRIIAPEHPGFGQSELPPWLDTVGDLALYYLDMLDTLHLSTVDLIGSSLGGWLAAEIAVLAPERIRRMVLVDACGVVPPAPQAPDFFMIPPQEMNQWLFYRPIAGAPAPEDPIVAARNRMTVARFAWNPRFYNPKLRYWLYRISSPTLLIWGANDGVVPPSMAEVYRENIPHVQLEMIAQCGHLPHLEQPERFVALVERHLQA